MRMTLKMNMNKKTMLIKWRKKKKTFLKKFSMSFDIHIINILSIGLMIIL
jgi:hypothetical protein